MKRVTIYEVAKEADVSLATVSRVINGSSLVKEDTKIKVQKAVEKLGYRPNAIAQGLALQKSTSIALVIPEASFTYTGQIFNGLIDVARIYKYDVLLYTINEGLNEMSDIIENILVSHVDGVIIYNDKLFHDELSTLNQYKIPIVIIGNRISGENIGSVFVDIRKACEELVSSYLDKGITEIGILDDRKHKRTIEKLMSGANDAFAKRGMTFSNYIKIPSEYRTSYEFLTNYFRKANKDKLLICYRDSHALAALNAANEDGIRVPDDLELVCMIDNKYNIMVRPMLSSYTIPSYDLGAVAMRLMTKMLSIDQVYEKEIELSYVYTPRQSTK